MIDQLLLEECLDGILADLPNEGVDIIEMLDAFFLEKLFEFVPVKFLVNSLCLIASRKFTQFFRRYVLYGLSKRRRSARKISQK